MNTSTNSVTELNHDLRTITSWLDANKLSLNVGKRNAIQFSGRREKTQEQVCMSNQTLVFTPVVKYLGVFIDDRLTFDHHVNIVRGKISRLCGILYKLSNILTQEKCLFYYNCYVKPVIQYGILVYGGTSYAKLEPIYILQKRILRTITRKRRLDSISAEFEHSRVLTVHELYTYELFKFLCRCIRDEHSDESLNNILKFETRSVRTRRSVRSFATIPIMVTNTKKNSLEYRVPKLYNFLVENNLIHKLTIANLSKHKFEFFIHSFKDNFIMNNADLTNLVFNIR